MRQMEFALFWFIIVIIISIIFGQYHYQEMMPQFNAPLENITTTQGREVHFTCVVDHLGKYRVAWIKSDSKAILAIHNRPVAQNPRLSVTHNGHNTWMLFISNVQRNDSGSYMCQINTDPMRSQLGYLNVTIPPDILDDEEGHTDGYQTLEGGTIHLRCRTQGYPEPEVSWKREDGKPIIQRNEKRADERDVVMGENLTLSKVNRTDMGVYLCLAKSSVPPIKSKRHIVRVNFKPIVHVPSDSVVAPIMSDGKLHCKVEAFPMATLHWINTYGEPIMANYKVNVTEIYLNEYTVEMNLVIKSLDEQDFGEYKCVAENTVSRTIGHIRLNELTLEKSTKASIKTFSKSPPNRHKSEFQKPFGEESSHHYHIKTHENDDSNDIVNSISSTSIHHIDNKKNTEISSPPTQKEISPSVIENNEANRLHSLRNLVVIWIFLRVL